MAKLSFYYNYSKKELYNLYLEASCDELTDPRFNRIKEALNETIPMAQYSYDSFINLLDSLFEISDTGLANIESGNFRSFYKAYLANSIGMPEDYYYMSIFIDVFYTDYRNIKSLEDFLYICHEGMILFKDIGKYNKSELMEPIKNANKELGELLETHGRLVDYNKLLDKDYNLDQMTAYSKAECALLVSFLINIDEYNHDYSIPSRIMNNLVDSYSPELVRQVGEYLGRDDNSQVLAKRLLDTQYYNGKDIYELTPDGTYKLEKIIKLDKPKD